MADTVKKSRIVSETDSEDVNLEEDLMKEFNIRLKSMSKDNLQSYEEAEPEDENVQTIYENVGPLKLTKTTSNGFKNDIYDNEFLQAERDHYYEEPEELEVKKNGHGNHVNGDDLGDNIYDSVSSANHYVDMDTHININNPKFNSNNSKPPPEPKISQQSDTECTKSVYEVIEPRKEKPTFTLHTTSFNEDLDAAIGSKSARDRMLLSTDDTSTLLFTQTVTSPMLTPSEENIDFLKGFRRESQNTISETTNTNSNGSPTSDKLTGEKEIVADCDDIFDEPVTTVTTTDLDDLENSKQDPDPVYANMVAENEILKEDETDRSEIIYENSEFMQNEKNSIYENVIEMKKESSTTSTTIEESRSSIYENVEVVKKESSISSKIENIYQNVEELKEELEKSSTTFITQAVNEKLIENHSTVSKTTTVKENGDSVLNSICSIEKMSKAEETKSEFKADKSKKSYEDCEGSYERESKVAKIADNIFRNQDNDSEVKETNREKDTETVPPQIVQNLKSQFMKSNGDAGLTKKEIEDIGGLKTISILKQITKFEQKDDSKDQNSTTQVHQSSYVETTTVEEVSGGQEKALKKKKTKKSRKEEKENISVSEHTNEGRPYYNVNVKSLCRSFGDLTKIQEDIHYKKPVYNQTTSDRLKSSFNKFDALQKKNVLHIRSSDSSKAQEKFNGSQVDTSSCKSCGKVVFQMEQIKAEKAIWHKNCFRCQECKKQLTVDIYESHEGALYCKPHFKALFAPKVIEEENPPKPRKHELIIRENQPMELPPDVVRASDKPSLGLEELQSLNVKERFHVFEHHQTETNEIERAPSALNVKRSPSILSKLAKFQSKGMDIGVSDEALNGIPIEESSSEEEEEPIPEGEDPDLIRAKRAQREKPFHFTGMSDVKNKWEHAEQNTKDERREERKQELQNIRNRLFMGKQGKMKEAYQQAVMESESKKKINSVEDNDLRNNEMKSVKERFEKGEVVNESVTETKTQNGDEEVYESEISKQSRTLFLELDAHASKPPQMSPITPPKLDVRKAREAYLSKSASQDVVKSSETVDEVTVETADIQQKFKFFETYKEPEKLRKQFRITPPREGEVKSPSPDKETPPDANVVRADEIIEDSVVAKESHTATKMLNKFRQMEENLNKEPVIQGPKPLKRFTPPPEPTRRESSCEEESGSEEESEAEEEVVDSTKLRDEELLEAQKAARAKHLRAKFEKWEANEIKKEQTNGTINIAEEVGEEQTIESTKILRARFESMKESKNGESRSTRVKVNRFVIPNIDETCKKCSYKVYPLEKISIHGDVYHKSCFKCRECSAVLRMDSYSYNQGLLYCTPHFKRLFITKGNYDTAFGLEQHKEKWNTTMA